MSKRRAPPPPAPPCYAMVLPGLEDIAAGELAADFGADIKKKSRGVVVFRPTHLDSSLLRLKTAEDVFLLGWGTDQLTHRARDLKTIESWTANNVNWNDLLKIHHRIRPKPAGKPTYRLVTQMQGKHVYRRVDALKALAKGLAGKFPRSWKPADENANIEVWLTIEGRTAVCGLRLSDRTMRHRRYKVEHMPASLRPTLAAALVRLAEAHPGSVVLDPMCGAGTILAEQISMARDIRVFGGDIEREALRCARANLRPFPAVPLFRWNALQLPLASRSIDCVICNPPFGKQLAAAEAVTPLYRLFVREMNRILKPGGKAVLLVADFAALRRAAKSFSWKPKRKLDVRVLGQKAVANVWLKP